MLVICVPLDRSEVKLTTAESNGTIIDKDRAAFLNVKIHSWLSSCCAPLFFLCWNMWWNQNMWHCFCLTKNNRWKIMLKDKFAFFPSFLAKRIIAGNSEQITFPKWPLCKIFFSFFLTVFHPSFLPSFNFTSLPGEVLSLMDDLFSGLGSSCVVAGRRTGDHPHPVLYSVVFKCLEPDSLYK